MRDISHKKTWNLHRWYKTETSLPRSCTLSLHLHSLIMMTIKQTLANRMLLIAATEQNHAQLEQTLQNGANPNAADEHGCTALMLCMQAVQPSQHCALTLLKAGADVNIRDCDGNTALHHSCKRNVRLSTTWLLGRKPHLHIKNNQGQTPLHIAAYMQNIDMIKLLLKSGANIHETDKFGNTPLHAAIQFARADTIKYLLEQGADATVKNGSGNSAIMMAVAYKKRNCLDMLFRCIKDINEVNYSGESLVYHSIFYNKSDILRKLISMGANLDTVTTFGDSPLMRAAMEVRKEKLHLLLNAGADINVIHPGKSLLRKHLAKKIMNEYLKLQRCARIKWPTFPSLQDGKRPRATASYSYTIPAYLPSNS